MGAQICTDFLPYILRIPVSGHFLSVQSTNQGCYPPAIFSPLHPAAHRTCIPTDYYAYCTIPYILNSHNCTGMVCPGKIKANRKGNVLVPLTQSRAGAAWAQPLSLRSPDRKSPSRTLPPLSTNLHGYIIRPWKNGDQSFPTLCTSIQTILGDERG